ncbi:hypothetical protein DH2020_041542 [Rehmannia glutinosa]|uniref:Kinesin-like protein n=1 Tax=Rehmannia glutinosa TaxID=99300 RepID=A0ABR0UPV4_REHGL
MEDLTRSGRVGELNLASRRAEEAALRRYQAVHWLDYLVGPLGISSQPSEKEFISCLRNGLILCNVINKIQPGSVQKVIENTSPSPSLLWDSQPLPAYQYFENVRNFLVAVEELKLPNFEASVFERENLEAGSSTKVVDCILALKDYHEWKQMTGGNGVYKPPKSPLVVHSAGRINARNPGLVSYDSSRQLNMSSGSNKPMPSASDIRKLEDTIVKALAEHMVDTKENMDNNLVASYHSGSADSLNFFSKILSSCLEEQFRRTFPELSQPLQNNRSKPGCVEVLLLTAEASLYPQTDEIEYLGLFKRKRSLTCAFHFSAPHRSVKSRKPQVRSSGGLAKELGICYLALNDLFELSDQRKDITNVLSVHVHGEDASSGSVIHSCLHLVDLAGSERVDKSEVTGDGLREAQHINKSLSCLVDVITALAQKNSHIPYRNSKLTLLLQNSLGGNAKTLMFAHVNPEGDSFGETMSTLKFAQRVSTVELGAARANKESNEVLELKAQHDEIDCFTILQIESLKRHWVAGKPKLLRRKKLKGSAKTPIEKPKQVTERTPPRPRRRLSIENGTTTMALERLTNLDDKKGAKTPSAKTRSRRLSLEGPRNADKNSDQMKLPESISKPVEPEVRCLQNHRAPLSPVSYAFKSPVVKIDTATMKVPPSFQIPKTPEPQKEPRNEIQRVLPNDRNISSENQTPCSTHGKGSQNQQKPTESTTPSNMSSIKHDAKSPISSNARTLRRQSITGIQLPERSRRSSLGGVSTDSYGHENRNAKTPPPQVCASAKLMKRWL